MGSPLLSLAPRIRSTGTTGWGGLAACWEWQGFRNPAGYGRFTRQGLASALVHRSVFVLVRGPIPEGLTLDHLCRNRACCNPFHLEPVTQAENNRRGHGVNAVNAAKTHCNNGHPLSGHNLKLERGGTARRCRTCAREAARRSKAKRRAERRAA